MPNAIDLIAAERDRQIQEEGWSLKHDRDHTDSSLAHAAAAYAMGGGRIENIDGSRVIEIWPTSWGAEEDAVKSKPRMRQLVIAGALIAAEIDRLQRCKK